MADHRRSNRNPWGWVPSLYLAEGLPYVVVMTVSAIMYKGMGVSNTDLALYTSWLYLPWVIKPLWSPVVDILGTRRRWIASLQLLLGGGLAGLALTIPTTHFFQYSLAFLWLLTTPKKQNLYKAVSGGLPKRFPPVLEQTSLNRLVSVFAIPLVRLSTPT